MADDYDSSSDVSVDTSSDTGMTTDVSDTNDGTDTSSESVDDVENIVDDGSDELPDDTENTEDISELSGNTSDVGENISENATVPVDDTSTSEEDAADLPDKSDKLSDDGSNELPDSTEPNEDDEASEEILDTNSEYAGAENSSQSKEYADNALGNAERDRDDAYQELNNYRQDNDLGMSIEPSPGEQELIDKYNNANDNYEKLNHAQEMRDAKFNDATADFNPNRWRDMSLIEKENAVDRLHNFCAEDLGLENKPAVLYYDGNRGDYGRSMSGAIGINRNEMDNPAETADTIAHENRHQYQTERAMNPSTDEEREWKDNLSPGNYIRPEDDRRGYWIQPVERDARAYAQEYKDRINGGIR